MNGKLAVVVHPEPDTLERVGGALGEAGLKVMAARSDREALERLGNFSLLMPDVFLTRLDADGADGTSGVAADGVLGRLRANPLTERLPVVVLGSGDGEERRRALRLGITHLVPPPYDGEELVLTTRLALEQHRDERLLSGTLDQLPVAELLQTAEAGRKTGTIALKSRGRSGTLWLRGGRIVDAETGDGRRGKEAVFALSVWDEGSFEADFGPISVPERITDSTSHLLLEAMRRKDEAARQEEPPPHAALPDPPPPPPRTVLAVHRALTLINVAASYAEAHLRGSLLEERLERLRAEVAERHPVLAGFAVGEGGRTALADELRGDLDAGEVAAGVGEWLRRFFDETERALPGRFSVRKLKSLTEAVQEDLTNLGFYRALGLPDADPEEEER
jgi:CheY-like chemotaxis protein